MPCQPAFHLVYQRYRRLVYVLALRIVNSPEDAEDITQDVFLRLYHQGRYDRQRGSLKNFLAMSARSRAIDKLRSRQAYARLNQTINITATRSTVRPLDQVIQGQAHHQIRQVLERLPPRERQVLESTYYHNLTQSEIAARLGIPLGTVKSRSRQGLQKMRKALTVDFPIAN